MKVWILTRQSGDATDILGVFHTPADAINDFHDLLSCYRTYITNASRTNTYIHVSLGRWDSITLEQHDVQGPLPIAQ
ncbi:hypothetical protein AB0M57_04920 [Streptomyces sp. NPDC051597]|uniref:hypothetical protein n=1 Tax=Streptomyces sp. NPDC051597 TaxID=3155049 RepID=UPI00343D8929